MPQLEISINTFFWNVNPSNLALWFGLKRFLNEAANSIKDNFGTPSSFKARAHRWGSLHASHSFDDGAPRF